MSEYLKPIQTILDQVSATYGTLAKCLAIFWGVQKTKKVNFCDGKGTTPVIVLIWECSNI